MSTTTSAVVAMPMVRLSGSASIVTASGARDNMTAGVAGIAIKSSSVFLESEAFSHHDQPIKYQPDRAENDDRSEDQRHLGLRGGEQDHIAEPGLGRDELADDDSDHRKRDCDLEPGEDMRDGHRKANLHIDPRLICPHGPAQSQEIAIDGCQAG